MNFKEKNQRLLDQLDNQTDKKMTVTEMKQKKASLLDDNKELLKTAERENRDLNSREAQEIEARFKEIDQLNARISLQTQRLIDEAENDTFTSIKNFKGVSMPRPTRKSGVEQWRSMAGDNKGKSIPVLSGSARLNNHVGNDDYDGSVEDYLIDRYRGFTSGKSRTMNSNADASMVPVGISSQIIDEARNLSSVFNAGAMVFPMSTKTETIARITESASPQWKAENAPHEASNILTQPLTFTAKTMIASVKSSVELAEDAGNLAQVVRQNLTEQLALELDRVALLGSGSGQEPKGIFHQDNVQSITLGENGGELEDYGPFSAAYEAILNFNGTPNATIFSPRTWGVLDRLVDSQNQPLNAPMSFNNLLKFPTSQVPNDLVHGSAENASVAFVGDFSKLMIGVRTNLVLEVTRVGSDDDSSAYENLQIWWRAYMRADIQLMYPTHFALIQGIIPGTD